MSLHQRRPRAELSVLAVVLWLFSCQVTTGSERSAPEPSRDEAASSFESGSKGNDPSAAPVTKNGGKAPVGGNPAVEDDEIPDVTVQRLKVEVQEVHPHDPGAFIQGLVWDGGVLYESTGLYGKSSLRRVEPISGQVLDLRAVDPNLFGEGLARVDDRLLQLTWKAGIVLVYDLASLELIDEYGFNGEGWGLAHDGKVLVMSDGTHRLTLRDRNDFRWLKTIEVTLNGRPLNNLNELELVDGRLYANVWGEERIVRIDLDSGVVDAVIDASGLLSPIEKMRVDVLNGIAYDPVSETFWLTGKFWPKMFQVKFVPAS